MSRLRHKMDEISDLIFMSEGAMRTAATWIEACPFENAIPHGERLVDLANQLRELPDKIAAFAALAEPDPVQEAVDDGEAATESWLKKIGGVRDDRVTASLTFHREDAMSIGFWLVDDGWKAMLIHHEHAASCIVRGLKTRGEIRRLLLSLKARDFLAKHAREGT